MRQSITYVGLDVHKDSIQVSMFDDETGEIIEWKMRTDGKTAQRLAKKMRKATKNELKCCYEAGPCGYGLQRSLTKLGIICVVIAPSLIPVKPGLRIKTDRRDAYKLAELLRADVLTEVHPPTIEEEAVRSLCRAREDAKEDLKRARQRMSKLLLLKEERYTAGKSAWTKAYHQWLRGLKFDNSADQTVFDDYYLAIEQLEQRLQGLVKKLEEVAQQKPFNEPVAWLRCFRGIDTVTAMTIVTELHGFARFTSPTQLMSYLGLVPSENTTGGHRRQGAITKTGNSHVRRILVEAAWHYRHPIRMGQVLKKRREGQPVWVVSIADKAHHRLHRRYWRLVNNGKIPVKANVAVAREFVGFIWDILYNQAIQNTNVV